MLTRRNLVSIGVAAALGFAGVHAIAAPGVQNRALEVVGAGAVSDPLIALEANRAAIVNRLVADHADALRANGIDAAAFRTALTSLRADQLLAASLVNSIQEVTEIVSQAPANGVALQRFVAVTPMVPQSMADVPSAEAYLVREGDTLSIVKASSMQLGTAGTMLVGYFAPATTSLYSASTVDRFAPKDGTGSGSNSWIGYTAGNNVASGTGSAVAAGTFNAASAQNSAVFAGQSNVASGISSLVIGGFDNDATAIDSLVGAGAGNRATGARSVVVGGGYNLASGQWSFVGGGGRQTGSGAAGTSAQDQVASGSFSTIAGGQGNRATGPYATVAGGTYNVASGSASFVGGGNIATPSDGNIASGDNSAIVAGYHNAAPGIRAFVAAGHHNVAAGDSSVAMGSMALTQDLGATPHNGSFVFSDGSAGNFRSTASNTFNVLATGGVRFVTQATNSSGEAAASRTVQILPVGTLYFPDTAPGRQAITMRTVGQGMGAQSFTLYLRTNQDMFFYSGGSHSDTAQDPGAGGSVLASLTTFASSTAVSGTFRAQVITATSDRNAKTAFESLSPKAILAKVASMPVMTWSYKNEADRGVRHIGPVAQDFSRLFNVGYDDKSIATVDADGVALAAIQGLKQELDEKNGKIDRLERELKMIKAKLGLK